MSLSTRTALKTSCLEVKRSPGEFRSKFLYSKGLSVIRRARIAGPPQLFSCSIGARKPPGKTKLLHFSNDA
jgi:hypothetical protein